MNKSKRRIKSKRTMRKHNRTRRKGGAMMVDKSKFSRSFDHKSYATPELTYEKLQSLLSKKGGASLARSRSRSSFWATSRSASPASSTSTSMTSSTKPHM